MNLGSHHVVSDEVIQLFALYSNCRMYLTNNHYTTESIMTTWEMIFFYINYIWKEFPRADYIITHPKKLFSGAGDVITRL